MTFRVKGLSTWFSECNSFCLCNRPCSSMPIPVLCFGRFCLDGFPVGLGLSAGFYRPIHIVVDVDANGQERGANEVDKDAGAVGKHGEVGRKGVWVTILHAHL